MPTVDAQQLRALVGAVVQPESSRRAIAVRSDAVWAGPDVLDGSTPVRVVPCASPLAVRAALVDHDAADGPVLAILTPCLDRDLGFDVLARLAKGRVLPVDPYSAVLGLFGARVLDPTLVRDERWMLDDLIALAPVGGWTGETVGGVLDLDTAWNVWHQVRFDRDVPADLDEILSLGTEPAVEVALRDLDDIRREALARQWGGGVPPAGLLLELVAAGHGADLAAHGLVADVLWTPTDDAQLAEQQRLGRARLEPLLGRDRLDHRAAKAWAEAARRQTTGDVAVLDRAERILHDAGVPELAVLSDDLVRGFEQRLIAVAGAVAGVDLDQAVSRLDSLRRHRLATSLSGRVLKAEASVRLLRRSRARHTPSLAGDFAAQAAEYAAEGAWVDEARLLLADGDPLTEVATVYSELCERLDDERRSDDLAFAAALAEWSRSEPVADDRIVPVEHILDQIVTRLAVDAPVLVLVCDGASLAVGHQLLTSLGEHGWARATPADVETWPVGVAMLPTVTEVSRASLLTGDRIDGGQKQEVDGFSGHPALRRVSSAARPPVLFHKRHLDGPKGHVLTDEVQANIADPDQRIVGAVINSVDDHLARGQQIKVTWDVETMGPLAAMLEAARDAGRVILITADHGHVIHGDGAISRPVRGDDDGGERWRLPSSPTAGDEVEVAGPRVLKGGHVVLPADDRIRYGGHKHGYHGGACPNEVLVPVEVVARTLPDRWVHRPLPKPTWWTGQTEPTWAAPPSPAPGPVTAAQPTLFEPEPARDLGQRVPVADGAPSGSPLVEQLLASPAYAAQRQRNPRAKAVADDRVRRYLDLLVDNGCTIPLGTLADRTGEPSDQLRMALMMVRRLLNFDGTEVLALQPSNDVELNQDLLRLQFDLEGP